MLLLRCDSLVLITGQFSEATLECGLPVLGLQWCPLCTSSYWDDSSPDQKTMSLDDVAEKQKPWIWRGLILPVQPEVLD